MGQILLARSATTDFDEQHRIIGRLDLPVNVRGQAELAALAEEWRGKPIATIYAAGCESARQSASVLGKLLGVKVRQLAELKNLDYGLWQGLQVDEVRRKHPKLFKQWEETTGDACPPAGETLAQVFERLPKALKPVLKSRPGAVVALFAPDPLRQIIRCYLRGEDCSRIWENGDSAPWELLEVDGGPGRVKED